MMQVFRYSPVTMEFTRSGTAQPSPREDGKFLIPANATNVPHPPFTENEIPVWNGSAWDIQPDFRGHRYKLGGVIYVITEIGDTIPEGAESAGPDEPPPALTDEERRDQLRAVTSLSRSQFGFNAWKAGYVERDEAREWAVNGTLPETWMNALLTLPEGDERDEAIFLAETASEVPRNSPVIAILAVQESISPASLDALFGIT